MIAASPVPGPERRPSASDFGRINAWVFDLDNTLYSADLRLFHDIDARMTRFIVERLGRLYEEARVLQKDYYARYGTTLAGLMAECAVEPRAFLDYVHDVDLAPIGPDARLARSLAGLPGRKFVFTNGSAQHARAVLGRLAVEDAFDAIFDIEGAGFRPKPQPAAYEAFLAAHLVEPAAAAMFDDIAENLRRPYSLGMTTVLVASPAPWIDDEPEGRRPARPGERPAHVHYATDDLAGFLDSLAVEPGGTHD